MYIKPLSAIINSCYVIHDSFAENLQLQLYLCAPPDKLSTLFHSMQSCISDIKAWTSANMPQLHDNKTEPNIFTIKRTKHQHSLPYSITVGDAKVAFYL